VYFEQSSLGTKNKIKIDCLLKGVDVKLKNMEKLLEGEVKLNSLTESVLLTNFRVMKEVGKSYQISIFWKKLVLL